MMKVLIVHAHPEPRSFSAALKRVAEEKLCQDGHQVVVSDLYQAGFNPVAGPRDFESRRDPEYLVYALEQRHAYHNDILVDDIRRELNRVLWADLIILNFPVFWFSVPAILKGWIDRVLISGVCYGGKRFYDRGGLKGRRGLISATLGGRRHMFGAEAIHGPLEDMMRHLLRGTLYYVGLDVLPPFIGYHIPYVTECERRKIIDKYRLHLSRLNSLTPLSFPSMNDFDEELYPRS